MCGIAGFVGETESMSAQQRALTVDRMCRVIRHRGPDDQGIMVASGAALGMRRLSIIDLQNGRQPISGEDGSVTVVFNGEIYNYRELRRDLESRGHRFSTNSDTESIVHAYEEYGAECLQLFRGMFAIALWDAEERTLFLARDRLGKKPLYYTLTGSGTLVFGSEIKSLLEHPEVERAVDPAALDAYLSFGYVPDPLCIFRGIHKLPPASCLTFSNGRITTCEYWDIPRIQNSSLREEDYEEELRALLDESVRIRLVADVPLGAFLSGGIDSSVVVGLMSRHSSRVKTFSIGFDEESFDELRYARLIARHFGTDHTEFVVTPSICEIVDELVWHLDEPFVDPSSAPTYIVSKLAAEHVKVVLSGDGGDELFAGYTRYVTDRRRSLFARLPRFVRKGLLKPLSRHMPHGAYGRNYLHNVALDPIDRYIDSISVFTEPAREDLYTAEFREQLTGRSTASARFRELAESAGLAGQLSSLLYLDSKTYLPGDVLTKVDRMSMAASLEARAPLLDHKLVEFASAIPTGLKLKGAETKRIFKRAVRGIVPSEILDRPKHGFSVPIKHWINGELRDRVIGTLTEPRTMQRGYLNQVFVDRLLDEHRRGRRDHAWALWSLFMLELWHRRFADAGSEAGSSLFSLTGPVTLGKVAS